MTETSTVYIDDLLQYKIFDEGNVISNGFLRGNTIKTIGRWALSMLMSGMSEYPIDTLWVGVRAYTVNVGVTTWFDTIIGQPIIQKARNGSTLQLDGGTLSVNGTFNWVGCGNSSWAASPFSSIGCTIFSGGEQQIQFSMLWSFTGQAAGMFGDYILASRFGGIGDGYDKKISSIVLMSGGVEQQSRVAFCDVLGDMDHDTTLVVTPTAVFQGPVAFDSVVYATADGSPSTKWFDKFSGFVMSYPAGETFTLEGKFVFDTISHST